MPSEELPNDLFISYAHLDNDRGQVRELRDAIHEGFVNFAGRLQQRYSLSHRPWTSLPTIVRGLPAENRHVA